MQTGTPARGPIASSEELPSVVALWTPRSECASVPSLDHPPLLARLRCPIGWPLRGFTERRETTGDSGCCWVSLRLRMRPRVFRGVPTATHNHWQRDTPQTL